MPIFKSGFDQPTGTLTASLQGEALGGAPGMDLGMDLGGVVGAILAERRRAEAAKAKQAMQMQKMMMPPRRQAPSQPIDPYGTQSVFQDLARVRAFRQALDSDRTAAQRASSMIGGFASQAFGDSQRQAQALKMAGFEPYEYTGIRDIVQGNAAASGEAARGASQERQQQSDQRYATDTQRETAKRQADALRRF